MTECMLRQVVVVLILLLPGISFAQIVTVIDDETEEPLELVTITSENPEAFAVTNKDGQADISDFKGADEIYFRSLNYEWLATGYSVLKRSEYVIRMQRNEITLDKAIVSASRWGQNNKDIAERVVAISPRDVALQNPQTAADLLGSTGEVFIQKSQLGGGSPMIRGFSTNRLLYAVDGVRMNTAIFRSGNLQNVINLDAFAIEGTEVLFGPGSIIYGSDAIGAVMSFQTLSPHFTLTENTDVSGKAAFRYSSASNERTGHFDVNVGWKKWAMLTSFTSSDFGDLRMGKNGPDDYLNHFYVQRQDTNDVVIANPDPLVQRPTGYQQQNFMQKVRFAPTKEWDFEYGFHYSTTSNLPRYDRLIQTRNGNPRSSEWNYGPQKWSMNMVEIKHRKYTWLYDNMNIRLAYQSFQESRIDRDFNDPIRYTRVEAVDAYSANIDLQIEALPEFVVFYGAEVIYNDVTSSGSALNINTDSTFTSASRYPNAQWQSAGAYLTGKCNVTQKFIIEGGLRYNYYAIDADFSNNSDFVPLLLTDSRLSNASLTGSLGAVVNPSEKSSVSISAAMAFRSPNVDDIGKVFDSEPGAVVLPNDDLRAEVAYNAEINYSQIIGSAFKVDLSGFYTVLEDAMVRRPSTFNGLDSIFYDGELSQVQSIQNAAQATVYGANIGVELRLPWGFGVSARYNYQIGEEELDDGTLNPSRHAAPAFGVLRLNYKTGKITMQCYAQYVSERRFEDLPINEQAKPHLYASDANGNPYAPAWYTLNFKALYRANNLINVSAGIENLTDQRYRAYSSGITGAGRNFIISTSLNF